MLTLGKVYYEIKAKKIVSMITFPEKGVWIDESKTTYFISGDKLIKKEKNDIPPENSLLHLCLTNGLYDYGLGKSRNYQMSKEEKTDTSETLTYLPVVKSTELYGKVILSRQNKTLVSMLIYDSNLKLRSKLFFKKYTTVGDLNIPLEILSITYPDDKGTEDYQLTTYSNVTIDSEKEDELFNYKIPSK